ncbi:hypothetical protein BH11ACT8_BH11ACT8_07170 [soil metagenome]
MRLFNWFVASSLALVVLAVVPAPAAHAADRSFAPRFTANDTGDIDIFGNTVMTCPTATAGCTAARTAGVTATADSALNNNNFAMVYIDVDSDPTTFNSSQATVSIPSGASVLFAGLYWGGEVTAGSGGSAAPSTSARNTVKLKAPGDAAYSTITAGTVDDGSIIYQGYADITARVAAGGNGLYTVGNIQTGTGADRLGGWTIVVAYRDTTLPARNLTVFDGLKSISGSASGTISVSGFQTPPAGVVNTTVGFVTYEGDLGLVGDGASLNGIALGDAQHPATNFFDSRSSRGGVLRTGANPSYANNLGFEHSMLTVGNTYISNGQTSATIGLTTAGDVYAPGVITFATDLYAPKIDQTKTVTDLNGGLVEQGDTLRYTISGTNNGQDGAAGFTLRDPIPTDTTYKPGTIKTTQVTGVTTSPTDAAGDDLAEYDAGANRVVARFGTGASSTAGGTVAPTKSYTLVFDVVVNGPVPVVPSGTTITNTATASFSSASLGTALTAASSATSTVSGPDLKIVKSHTGTLVQGSNATYTLAVSNVGTAKSQGPVTVTDTLPAGLTYVSATGSGWSCSQAAGKVTCTRSDSLAAGSAYPGITLTALVADGAPAQVANTGTVAGGGDGVVANNSSVDSAPTVAITDLSLAKSASPTSINVGGTVTLSLTGTNNGPSRSTGSTITDTLPAGLTYTSGDPGCASGATASTVLCEVGPINAGASAVVHVTATAAPGTAGSTQVNTAAVSAHETDPTPGNNTAGASVTVKPVDLAITSQVVGNPASLTAGTSYTWALDVANLGDSPAADGTVRFTVPVGLTVTPGGPDPRCALDGTNVVCLLGTVPGASTVPTILITATVTGVNPPATIDTTASVSTTEPDANAGNNTATTSTPVTSGADLAVALAASPSSVGAGDTLTLTASVSNLWPGTPVDPTVSVVIPVGTTFVSAPAGCTYDGPSRTVTCTLPATSLQPGESLTRGIVVLVGPDPADPLTSSATVSSTSPDPDLSNNTASVGVPVLAYAGLSITKSLDKATAKPGETVTYTVTATNAGPATARDVVVSDTVPAGTTLTGASPAACTASGADVSCAFATLAPGQSRVATITATVDPISTSPSGAFHQLDVTKVETNLALPASMVGTATASCPSGYLATDGSVRIDDVDQGNGLSGVQVLASGPTADGHGWTGVVRNTTAGQAQTKVNVVCLSSTTTSAGGHTHDVSVSGPVASTHTWTYGSWDVDAECGAGRTAISPSFAFASGYGVVRSSMPTATGWHFTVDVPESAQATLSVLCLATSLTTTAGHTHDLALHRITGTVTVPANGTAQTQLTCGELEKGITASYDLDPGLLPAGNDPQPKTRVFRFINPTGAPLTARVGLLCLSTRTGPELGVVDITNTAHGSTSSPDLTSVDDVASATFTASAASGMPRGISAAGAASVTTKGRTTVRLRITTPRTSGATVRLLTLRRQAGLAKGTLVAHRTTSLRAGTSKVALRVTKKAAGALRHGDVRRVRLVIMTRDGHRLARIVRLVR